MKMLITFCFLAINCGVLFFANTVVADNITKPHTFTSGTNASASEVNANFDTVYEQVNKIGSLVNIDSVNSRIGIGTSSPASLLDVAGSANIDGGLVINESGGTNSIRVESDNNPNMFQVHGGYDQVRIYQTQNAVSMLINTDSKSALGDLQIISDNETGQVLRVEGNSLTTGTTAFMRNFNSNSTGQVLFLQQAGDGITLLVDTFSKSVIGDVLIKSDNETGQVFRINGDHLTTGTAAFIRNYNSASTGNVLHVQNLGTGKTIYAHQTNSGDAVHILQQASSIADATALKVEASNSGTGKAYAATFSGGPVIVKRGNTNEGVTRNQMIFQYYKGNAGHAIKTQHNNAEGNAHRNAIDFYLWQDGDEDDQPTKHVLRLRGDGKVGINTTAPTRTFYVNGDAGGTTAWYNDSDERLKKNITTIEDALGKVQSLRGVQFEWKDTDNHPEGKQMGFIAQEAVDIIPEVVEKKGDDSYSMQYAPVTALLVEAIKELKAENEVLKAIICEEFPEKSICQ